MQISGSYLVPACNNLTQLALYVEGPAAGVTLIVDDVAVQQRLSIPVVPVPPPTAPRNVLTTGDFELGMSGWFGFGASVALTTSVVHAGAARASPARARRLAGTRLQRTDGARQLRMSIYAQQSSGSASTLALSAKLTCGGVDSFATIGSASALRARGPSCKGRWRFRRAARRRWSTYSSSAARSSRTCTSMISSRRPSAS